MPISAALKRSLCRPRKPNAAGRSPRRSGPSCMRSPTVFRATSSWPSTRRITSRWPMVPMPAAPIARWPSKPPCSAKWESPSTFAAPTMAWNNRRPMQTAGLISQAPPFALLLLLRLRSGRLHLRHGHVSHYFVLLHLVHHDLNRLAVAGQVKLHRLVDGAISLLHSLVVSQHIQSEAVSLGVGLRQRQLDGANLLHAASPLDIEFLVVAFAEVLQRGELPGIGGDQSAHHSHIASHPLELGTGLLHFSLRRCDVAFHAAHIAADRVELRAGVRVRALQVVQLAGHLLLCLPLGLPLFRKLRGQGRGALPHFGSRLLLH